MLTGGLGQAAWSPCTPNKTKGKRKQGSKPDHISCVRFLYPSMNMKWASLLTQPLIIAFAAPSAAASEALPSHAGDGGGSDRGGGRRGKQAPGERIS